jgi:site-specific recombinase XerD
VSYSSIAPQALLAIANNENIQRLTMEGPIFGTKAKKLLDQFVQETKQSIVKLGGRNERLFQKLELWGALEKRTAENEKKAVALKENANSKIHPFSSAPASVLHKPAKTDGVQSGGFLSGMGDYFKLSS